MSSVTINDTLFPYNAWRNLVLIILINLVKIIIGFILLIKGADFFVDGSAAVARKLGIPQIVIGLTIVALGTSAPEAAVSISAALKGNNGISIGNVLGSNIMNVLLILGITAVITALPVKKGTIRVDIPFMIFSTILLVAWGSIKGKLTALTGLIFLTLLIGYIIYLIWYSKNHADEEQEETKQVKTFAIPLFILGGIVSIIFGSNIAVDGAAGIALFFGVSDRIIGLTIVAFGTSLPELMTSVTAARKGEVDLAIGNIVGSNLFNILFILGMTSVIIDLPYISDAANFMIDGFVALGTAILLFLLSCRGKLKRTGGIIMLLCYTSYFIYLLAMQ